MDTLFKDAIKKNQDFKFNHDVSKVFNDMIFRSVPFYNEVHRMIVDLIKTYTKEGDVVCDFGCSTGTLCFSLADNLIDKKLNIIGIDASEEMIKLANEKKSNKYPNINFYNQDIRKEKINTTKYKVAIFNLTLQFIRPLERIKLLNKVYSQMKDGGIIIIFEKNVLNNSEYNRNFIKYYYNFKKLNHYSDQEISNKRLALENILIPYTFEENKKMLAQANFKDVQSFFQWFNFSALIAKK